MTNEIRRKKYTMLKMCQMASSCDEHQNNFWHCFKELRTEVCFHQVLFAERRKFPTRLISFVPLIDKSCSIWNAAISWVTISLVISWIVIFTLLSLSFLQTKMRKNGFNFVKKYFGFFVRVKFCNNFLKLKK